MKERPILLTSPEVRTVLAGGKTQMRRAVKSCAQFRDFDSEPSLAYDVIVADDQAAAAFLVAGDHGYTDWVPCPYGKPGDRLWVRETWQEFAYGYDPIPLERFGGEFAPYVGVCNGVPLRWRACYAADGPLEHPTDGPARWRSPTNMPRWASRITLEVTAVRVERLHDITEEDADAEGVLALDGWIDEREIARKASEMRWCLEDSRPWFAALWEEVSGKKAPWSSNPWVWVVDFRVAEVRTGAKEA